MDFKSLFDIVESFGVGLAIIILFLILAFLAYVAFIFISGIFLNIPIILDYLFNMLLLICILIIVGILIYLIGKNVKMPLKNKIDDSFNFKVQNSLFCPNCGIKLRKLLNSVIIVVKK